MVKRMLMLSIITTTMFASAEMVIKVDCCTGREGKQSERHVKLVTPEGPVIDVAAASEECRAFKFGEREAIVSVNPAGDSVVITVTIAGHIELKPQVVMWGQPAIFTCSETGTQVRVVVEKK